MAEKSAGSAKSAASATSAASGGPEASELTYEQARDELADVVTRLEAGGTTLEEALGLWERGEVLATVCQQWLDGAREKLAAARAAQPDQD